MPTQVDAAVTRQKSFQSTTLRTASCGTFTESRRCLTGVLGRVPPKVENLSVNKKQLLKMVLKFPKLLDYGVEASYAPLVEWFRSYLGLNTREVSTQPTCRR